MKALAHMAALSAAGLLAVSAGYALGQQSAPTDYKLVAENVLATIDLAAILRFATGRRRVAWEVKTLHRDRRSRKRKEFPAPVFDH